MFSIREEFKFIFIFSIKQDRIHHYRKTYENGWSMKAKLIERETLD